MLFQDPVYGKGKLAEIQGLILGMLDTFNYEQVKLLVKNIADVADVAFPRRPTDCRRPFCFRLYWKPPPVC